MKRILCLSFLSFILQLAGSDKPYDFRASEAYKQLSAADRQKLEQVRLDHVLLWGALEMSADQHNGNPPATLDDLVPAYLRELPSDPFATRETTAGKDIGNYTQSKGGLGYRFMRGAPGNRAWVIASVGFPDFPYLAARGNIGLYVCKGTWIGNNLSAGRAFGAQPSAAPNAAPPHR